MKAPPVGYCMFQNFLRSYDLGPEQCNCIQYKTIQQTKDSLTVMESALEYHYYTSYDRHTIGGHSLDWANQPNVYKMYTGVEFRELPRDVQLPGEKLSLLLKKGIEVEDVHSLDPNDISRIFMLTYSLTARTRHPGGDLYYRSAASAGALYPTEIYIAVHGVNNLDDGLYHYSVSQHGLALLRKGDLNSYIAKIVPFMSSNGSVLIFFLSAVFFRSAWKYRDRSYRYDLLDTGHVAENLILALRSIGIPFTLSYDFDDHKANRLLGLDEKREVSLAVLSIEGRNDSNGESVHEISELPDEMKDASRVALTEKMYPAILEIHRAGYRPDSTERSEDHMTHDLGVNPDEWDRIEIPEMWPENINFAESVFARRSRRNFVRERISKDHTHALLNSLFTMNSRMIHTKERRRPIAIGMLSGDVEGLASGFSLLEHSTKSIGMISKGHFLDKMAHICLDQQWLANAALHFLFLADLEGLDRQWGARGYRYAMMEAGRLGERLYLAATAMGLGCCGIGAFFDGEAAELLGINKRSRLLYLVAVGPVKGGL